MLRLDGMVKVFRKPFKLFPSLFTHTSQKRRTLVQGSGLDGGFQSLGPDADILRHEELHVFKASGSCQRPVLPVPSRKVFNAANENRYPISMTDKHMRETCTCMAIPLRRTRSTKRSASACPQSSIED